MQWSSGLGIDLPTHLEIDKDAAWDVLASPSLGEEGVEGIVATTNRLVHRHLTIGLNAASNYGQIFCEALGGL
jgi:hypothetical protein